MSEVSQNQLTLRFLAEPTDVNFGGKVHGGAVMKWIDQAGYACATAWCGNYCVTVYVGGIRFFQPIKIGDLVEINAKVIYTGKTSMHVAVDVLAKNPREQNYVKTTHCIIVFVSVNEEGQPQPVRKWIPVTETDRKLEQYAQRLMALRQGVEQEMQDYLNSL